MDNGPVALYTVVSVLETPVNPKKVACIAILSFG